jgi:2-desacetyl-2-hydroxyethyl bacteriochlorophyllide A dehydrogenase
MIAAFCTGPHSFELRDVEPPPLGDEDVLVHVRSCGICGSDLHYFTGGFPAPPVCPGHEISGEVVDVGRRCGSITAGTRVAIEPLLVCGRCAACRTGNYQLCDQVQVVGTVADGGFAELVRMPERAVFPLPASLDCEVGALTEPLAVAVHAVRLAGVSIGHRVLVLGGGSIGLLSVAAARHAGATDVWITARHPQQVRAAERMGATRVFTGAAADAEVGDAAREQAVDVVLETVGGSANTLDESVHLVRRGGTVAVLGVFMTMPSVNALVLVVKEVRLVGSMTYGRPGPRADFDVALDLLAADPERFRTLITHRYALADIAEAFETASDKKSGSVKVAIQQT